MRRIKKGDGLTRLLALLLALAMLLTGCGGPAEDGSAEPPADSGAPSETGGTASSDASSGSGSDIQDDSEETAVSPEDARLLARTGLPQSELVQISAEEAGEISRASAGMWKGYVAGPNGEDPLVESRDWSKYSSSLGQEKLSNREAEFFKRLDKMCLKYLSTSGLDGVKNADSRNKNTRYKIDGVRFGDLGLSADKVRDLLIWFTYNNPQYYFLNAWGAWASDTVYPCIYEFAADGEKRAEITNELFDKLDGWIQTVAASASTDYEKELYANNLICESVTYDHDACDADNAGDDTAMWICQSIYSSVILEDTVCAGYSKTFTAMMRALDVDATAGLSVGHAWNVVRCDDGNCYCVDVCWNDTDGNPPYDNDYLNVGDAASKSNDGGSESHTYDKDLAAWIPAIAKEDYAPTQGETIQQSDEPQNLRTQEVGPTSITLAWDEAAGTHMNHRHQYEAAVFADASRSKQLYHRNTSEASFTFETLNPNTSYEFGVRLRCNDDDYVSEWTCLRVATADGEPKKLASIPYNIKTEYKDANQAATSWSGSDFRSFTSPEVCQYTDSTCTQMEAGYPQDPGSNYGYTWTGLEPGKTYYFGVRLSKKDGVETIYSDWVNFSYTHGSAASDGDSSTGGEKPPAPTNIEITSTGETKIEMTWDPVSGADVYAVCAYADSSCTEVMGDNLYTFSADEGEYFRWSGVKAGTTYYFGVRAGKDVNGETAYSEWVDYSYTHMGHS